MLHVPCACVHVDCYLNLLIVSRACRWQPGSQGADGITEANNHFTPGAFLGPLGNIWPIKHYLCLKYPLFHLLTSAAQFCQPPCRSVLELLSRRPPTAAPRPSICRIPVRALRQSESKHHVIDTAAAARRGQSFPSLIGERVWRGTDADADGELAYQSIKLRTS